MVRMEQLTHRLIGQLRLLLGNKVFKCLCLQLNGNTGLISC